MKIEWHNKKVFSEEEINQIKDMYTNSNFSAVKIGEIFNVSKTPINRILKELNLLKGGKSDGKKINLSGEVKEKIKDLYLNKFKSAKEIGEILGLNASFVDKYLSTVNYRRNKSSGASIGLVKRFSGIDYNTYLKNLPEQEKYTRLVINLTNKQPIHLLKNYEKRGCSGINGAYHLDHKYSILEGYKNNINPEIIASLNNLVFIPWKDNVMKRTKCSITKEELINI